MTWNPGPATDRVYQRFLQNPTRAMHRMGIHNGDQAWIGYITGWTKRLQKILPGFFASYKVNPGIREKAAVVVFHGKPRPNQTGDHYAELWQKYAELGELSACGPASTAS
jgi:hypothetical protein